VALKVRLLKSAGFELVQDGRAEGLSLDERAGVWVKATPDEGGVVYLRLSQRHGRTICTGLHINGGDQLTAVGLRRLGLGLLAEMAEGWIYDQFRNRTERPPGLPPAWSPSRGRHGYPAAHYEAVAELYHPARAARPPQRPTAYIQANLPIQFLAGASPPARRTVSRWLKQCRERGLLDARLPDEATPLNSAH
jgi:hypothetical protein